MIPGSRIALMKSNAPAHNYATWDPANKGATAVLSNGNLTWSVVSVGSTSGVKGTLYKDAGKHYWEIVPDHVNVEIGIAIASAGFTGYGEGTGWATWFGGGGIYGTLANGSNPGTWTAGDVIGCALDMSAGTFKVNKNNGAWTTLASSLSVPIYPAISSGSSGAYSAVVNFGATALAYAPPSGHNAGFYL